jgi:colanic acid/amylovoran biosynthesis protein
MPSKARVESVRETVSRTPHPPRLIPRQEARIAETSAKGRMGVPVRIVLFGARLCRNLGGPSLLTTTMSVLDEVLRDTAFTFVSPTLEDVSAAEAYGIPIIRTQSWKRVLPAAVAKASLGLSVGSPDIRRLINACAEADIFIDVWGIGFADSLGADTFVARARQGIHLLLGRLFRKPVVKYTADLGPFESRWNRFFSKLYLQYAVDLILARSDATQERLCELGVTTPIRVCPDTAFLLQSHPSPLAQDLSTQKGDRHIVGLSVSHMAARQSDNPATYLDSMAGLADHVAETMGARVLLIPNEFSATTEFDDAHVAGEIRNRMERKAQSTVVSSEYTAQQLKGIIGQCDVLVGARYHSIVAALSQGVPVLAIGWHAKYAGVLSLVGQERYLCPLTSLALDDLEERFDDLWQSRDAVRQEIDDALPKIREAILGGGQEVRLLLNKE